MLGRPCFGRKQGQVIHVPNQVSYTACKYEFLTKSSISQRFLLFICFYTSNSDPPLLSDIIERAEVDTMKPLLYLYATLCPHGNGLAACRQLARKETLDIFCPGMNLKLLVLTTRRCCCTLAHTFVFYVFVCVRRDPAVGSML